MELSIIINHYKTPVILKLCLKYLFENLPSNLESEVILVDGETQRETKEILKNYPSIIFVPFKKNVGFAKLANTGIRKSKGEFIFLINADIIIDGKENILKMLNYMKKNPDVGILGPKLLNINGSFQQSCFRFYTPLTVICRRTYLGNTFFCKKNLEKFLMKDIFKNPSKEKKPVEVDWVMGSALLIRKKSIEKIGLFDERFFMYFEDVDLCKRFWKVNQKVVWFPEAVFYHYHLKASKGKKGIFDILFNKYTRIHLISAIKYFIKHKIT